MKNKPKDCNSIRLNNYTTYCCTLIYNNHAIISFKKDKKEFSLKNGEIAFLKRGETFDVEVISTAVTHKPEPPYYIIYLTPEIVSKMYNLMRAFFIEIKEETINDDSLFTFCPEEEDSYWIKRIFSTKENNLFNSKFIINIMSIILEFEHSQSIIQHLTLSKKENITDRVIALLEAEPSRNWYFTEVCDRLYLSESTLRKKLELENINFKKLLLDFKMKKAAELLKTTNKSITMISSELGYVYASYFIKVFKNYFGVTPKQFLKKFTY
ncbi:helix-turn-helix transcriptional regulator [Escherichia coli]|uniref:helix-turn-helix transcriptional regulator n=1 Tax=Escherichia coli TaxID=562 RepID=UPI000BB6593C|nr:AraC family transcriptional regulator [Escherichia coli]EHH7506730.1 helix-turn-helix transcriptional regulator [Escherichia coli]EIZ3827377.1 helix-turn-helix transcriptional regulator [Escherichia coli]EIZ3842733.1 helix-turn-helix transcriptional regulator [Escherichia coli]EIZ3847854.1 helix-turn-helix transcriptional regulator [Escherichia coli]EIZ3857443.1 helix-turn-helix transcriptional regulator [Escherichia coli]